LDRIHCLLSGIDSTRSTINDLMAMQIDARHIHLIAAEGASFDLLSEDSLLQNSGYVPALQKGLGAGGAIGSLAGLLGASYPPAGLSLAGGALLSLMTRRHELRSWFSHINRLTLTTGKMEDIEHTVRNGGFLVGVDLMAGSSADIIDLLETNGGIIRSERHGNKPAFRIDPAKAITAPPAGMARKQA
jgi:hypothetical protein